MSSHARAIPQQSAPERVEDVTARVRHVSERTDWHSYLPPQAATRGWTAQQRIKRALDITLAAAGLLALAPLFLVVAAAVKLSSRGPVFYRWRVLGRHARPFVGYKFRTMVVEADALRMQYLDRNEMRGPVFKMRDDPRVTRVGRLLRRYSIDELPQLYSVLKGDMSLVGPRPPFPEEFARFEPWQWGKLAVTPGITCLWQVDGRSEIADFEEWARLDLEYIRNWNLGLDASILLRTLPAVFSGRGAY